MAYADAAGDSIGGDVTAPVIHMSQLSRLERERFFQFFVEQNVQVRAALPPFPGHAPSLPACPPLRAPRCRTLVALRP